MDVYQADFIKSAVKPKDFPPAELPEVAFVGRSNVGKSSLINVLAGLDTASSGNVFMDGREVSGPSLERGVVFQGHALMPWLTVRKNIAFAVNSRAGPTGVKPRLTSRWKSSWPWWA